MLRENLHVLNGLHWHSFLFYHLWKLTRDQIITPLVAEIHGTICFCKARKTIQFSRGKGRENGDTFLHKWLMSAWDHLQPSYLSNKKMEIQGVGVTSHHKVCGRSDSSPGLQKKAHCVISQLFPGHLLRFTKTSKRRVSNWPFYTYTWKMSPVFLWVWLCGGTNGNVKQA